MSSLQWDSGFGYTQQAGLHCGLVLSSLRGAWLRKEMNVLSDPLASKETFGLHRPVCKLLSGSLAGLTINEPTIVRSSQAAEVIFPLTGNYNLSSVNNTE